MFAELLPPPRDGLAVLQDYEMRDRSSPATEILGSIVLGELPPETQPRLLGQVLGVVPIEHQRKDVPPQRRFVLSKQSEEILGGGIILGSVLLHCLDGTRRKIQHNTVTVRNVRKYEAAIFRRSAVRSTISRWLLHCNKPNRKKTKGKSERRRMK